MPIKKVTPEEKAIREAIKEAAKANKKQS